MENPYKPKEAVIEEIIEETPSIETFRLKPKEEFEFKAGQFIELTVPGIGEAPFTPSSSPYIRHTFDVTVMEVGKVTGALHRMKKGEVVGIRGPYGYPYPLDKFFDKEILIVGGGVGLAPLRSLLLALFHNIERLKKIVLKYGARTPSDIMYKKEIESWREHLKTEVVLTVDRGDPSWKGNVGLITSILGKAGVNVKNAISIVCGPPTMMKFVTMKLIDLGFKDSDIYLSMERNMSCGVGMCFHCRLGKYYVCKDGPVFTWEQVKDIPDPF